VTLIDFGLASVIERQKKGFKPPSFFGTPKYAPLAAHLKKLQGFRDDLESLAYCFYEPLTGKPLPWTVAKGTEAQVEKARVAGKTKPPSEIKDFVKACRALAIDEMPDDYSQFVLELVE
jgi:serine/threonine protein kinase